jgi:hypothetical protein
MTGKRRGGGGRKHTEAFAAKKATAQREKFHFPLGGVLFIQ